MRLLVYNIAYGTGCPGAFHKQLWTIHRYLKTPRSHLDRIIDFIDNSNADIVGLIEVDTGSYRTGFLNQVEAVANHLTHYHRTSVKYGVKSLGRKLPILNKQANAILTRDKSADCKFHYFPIGFKKLIIEVETGGVKFFLVHLALQKRIRKRQLEYLADIAKTQGPTIIAGDFNTFHGEKELAPLRKELKLISPNGMKKPTYPSWKPKRQLDFILCTKDITIKNFEIPDIRFSDHLPLILDFSITN